MTPRKSKQGWRSFLKLCAEIESSEEMEKLFNLFFTMEEKETLASRYLIIKALLEGNLPQREIADTHKVSIAQITRGSNALKIIPSKLRAALKSRMETEGA